ncbi:peptide chain release factor N(5)-glutamine methyltransferase [Candidatus Magnetaquicoccus inordinatus]|uniref:peptide chain release factor N(5)-glutamine methyltransferase n=1 Tax=Candidatus Magnetaquicoccus inordinatus TaxID=2496818 RepID=UPI00102C162C|nr:peptide chain release factor N(5)-glutamine methyltransferase [Candidatus Magnetaquicoccus inordinatus]
MTTTLWTIQALQAWAVPWLQQRGVESPRLDCDLLLAEALGVERLALFLDPQRPVIGEELARFKQFMQRRARREPVAYILRRRQFWRHEFLVTPDVLIPRPETELLVETVLDLFPPAQQSAPFMILEVGIGSGALLCSLLLEYPTATGIGIDLSAAALQVAQENAERLGCGARMTLLQGDLVAPLELERYQNQFLVIVANLPYIAPEELLTLQPEVVQWEPSLALNGGADGVAVICPLPAASTPLLAENGLLALEIGATQGDRVAEMMRAAGLQEVMLRLDYARLPRVVSGRRLCAKVD